MLNAIMTNQRPEWESDPSDMVTSPGSTISLNKVLSLS